MVEATLRELEPTLAWLLVLAGVAFILGARRAALSLAIFPLMYWAVPPGLAPLLEELPAWQQAVLAAVLGLLALHGLVTVLFGRETAGTFTGILLVRLFDLLIRGPLRGLRMLWLRYFE